jgi:hypothetical protein
MHLNENVMKKILFVIALFVLISSSLIAQVGINSDNSEPNPSSILDVKSTTKGLLIPRMTFEQRNTIPIPIDGLVVFCTNCSGDGTGVLSIYQGGKWRNVNLECTIPNSPVTGTHIAGETQITWNWNTVQIALGYKWNTTNDYASALDMETVTTKTETGLACASSYTRYVWAYNSCGNSSATSLTRTTNSCVACGSVITVTHQTGVVAPVNKTVTYGIIGNVPGEALKCWITSNLGASHQAVAINDATEASAGWYWQFNHKQGYMHDGTNRTPDTQWVTSYNESSDWLPVNDPCTIELGTPWRIPTNTEWTNVKNTGGWTNGNGPWNSDLKMHTSGYLDFGSGSLADRGTWGYYWGSNQFSVTHSRSLYFNLVNLNMYWLDKAYGFTLRCIKD